jgi:hypothetical protein
MKGSLQMEQMPCFSPLLAKEAVIKMKKEDEKFNSAEKTSQYVCPRCSHRKFGN